MDTNPMPVDLKYWREQYPDVEEETLIDWLSDMTVKEISKDDQAAYIKEQYDKTHEPEPELEPEKTLKEQVGEHEDTERFTPDEPDIPFNNPDLSNIDVPEDEPDDEELDLEPEPEPEPERVKPAFHREEMITKTISVSDYEAVIRPFKPFIEDIKQDHNSLNRFAQQMDGHHMPPYMQIKPYIINHEIKDPNNTQVLLTLISEANAKAVEQKFLPITQAVDVTRTLAEQAWFQAALNNYDVIIEKMFEERKALVSLVYILENYCEQKQPSPFELSIPKQVLMDSVEQSFQNIKQLITDNVIKEMSTLREDLQGEMIDVGQLVEKNMTRFDSQIQEAVTKVLWKVKTDVESTNLEDIKKSLLWLLNKRSASYNLGGTATAILSVMLDHLERRLIQEGFKLENIKEHRKYTMDELSRKLGYKTQSLVIRTVPNLLKHKLIKVYQNKTISL